LELENRFSGWTDVDLSEKGIAEAHQAGQQLANLAFHFDLAFTSVLKRAIRTFWIMLDEKDLLLTDDSLGERQQARRGLTV
jgi:2,3-bisphosphoglycerate-dependent phosphoglycerate mutase